MKTLVSILAAVAILGLTVSVSTAADKKAGLRGKIVKVDGANVTIKTRAKAGEEAKEITVVTDDKTVVTIDGKEAKVADLKDGMYVSVTPETGTATKIEAKTSSGHAKKGDAPAPAK